MRSCQNINLNWRFHVETDPCAYEVSWTPNESNLFGTLSDIGGIDGIMWCKAGRSVGPASLDFDDAGWQNIDLPHDWSITQRPSPDEAERNGYLPAKVLWYRKTITLPDRPDAGRVVLRFDGAFRHASVFANGHFLHLNQSGYTSFRVNLSDVAEWGRDNTIAVRLDPRKKEEFSYEGAGIYRHVWLELTQPFHIREDSLFVHADVDESGQKADITITAEVVNDAVLPKNGAVTFRIIDPDDNCVAETSEPLAHVVAPGASYDIESHLRIDSPVLWDVDQPKLYRLDTVLTTEDDAETDRLAVAFGIRSVRFDPDQGFILNGKRIKLKGVCNHFDHAGVGMAVPDRLHEWRIAQLKEMGVNAYRCAHNPVSPEFLDACDRMGLLVMAENRVLGSSPEVLGQVEALVRRDRNHPSVVIWSLGNEEMDVQFTDVGERIIRRMKRVVQRLDSTRPICAALNGGWEQSTGFIKELDVLGANYLNLGDINQYHQQHPKLPIVLTEEVCRVSTRGEYRDSVENNVVHSYDRHEPPVDDLPPGSIWAHWGRTAESMWKEVAARDFLAGVFVWCGIDYLGEPSPFNRWPITGCYYGAMDSCGFPKDLYYYYRSMWHDQPTVHLFPHWTWPGTEGRTVNVWCYTSGDEAELFLNDCSLGVREVSPYGHAEWDVPYQPGILKVVSRQKGTIIGSCVRKTAGAPARLCLETAYPEMRADGLDIAIINGCLLDKDGEMIPDGNQRVTFSVDGPARVIGVGNGNPCFHDVMTGPECDLFNGRVQVIIRSTGKPGNLEVCGNIDGLEEARILITNP